LTFATTIIYSDKVQSPILQTIITYNPLTYFVCSARNLVVKGTLYNPELYFIYAAISLVVFMFSWHLFYISENKVIERMV